MAEETRERHVKAREGRPREGAIFVDTALADAVDPVLNGAERQLQVEEIGFDMSPRGDVVEVPDSSSVNGVFRSTSASRRTDQGPQLGERRILVRVYTCTQLVVNECCDWQNLDSAWIYIY